MSDTKDEAGIAYARLLESGMLEPGQPTEEAHREHIRRMEAEFTPRERRLIRDALRLMEET